MLMFYALSPVPSMIARRYADSLESSSALIETCYFFTAGIVISAYGLPIVLAHTPMTGPVVSETYTAITTTDSKGKKFVAAELFCQQAKVDWIYFVHFSLCFADKVGCLWADHGRQHGRVSDHSGLLLRLRWRRL